jgi:hypothetical protein
MRAELFHADRHTNLTNLIVVAFRNFANAPKKRDNLITSRTLSKQSEYSSASHIHMYIHIDIRPNLKVMFCMFRQKSATFEDTYVDKRY